MKLLIKVGGTLLENDETRRSLAEQLAARAASGDRTVVVHGGGKRLSRYLQKQGVESEFRNGLRVTPREIMDAVLRIYSGEVNHRFLAELGAAGARAVGLSGVDAGMVRAVQLDPELGAVGRVEEVNPAVLDLLTEAGYLPLVACVAGGAQGAIFNVNADQMAAACGDGFQADELIFLTDVAGVLREDAHSVGSGRRLSLLRNAMVSIQVAVSLILVVGAGVFAYIQQDRYLLYRRAAYYANCLEVPV